MDNLFFYLFNSAFLRPTLLKPVSMAINYVCQSLWEQSQEW